MNQKSVRWLCPTCWSQTMAVERWVKAGCHLRYDVPVTVPRS